jgi:hypothetical protein
MGLQDSVRITVDVAAVPHYWRRNGPRVTLVRYRRLDSTFSYIYHTDLWISRRWLVRKGRIEDAKKALLRLTSKNRETNFDPDETVAMMIHTTALEEKITRGASYWDCFRGTDLRRTEIVRIATIQLMRIMYF